MRKGLVLSILLLISLSAGCLGSVTPAGISEENLPQGWAKTSESDESLVLGMGQVVTRDYGPSTARIAGVTVATVNDIPLVDERERLVPLALAKVEEREGITFNELGTQSFKLAQLGTTVTATEYDVEGAQGPAKALLFTPSCTDFVVVVAYGSTESVDGGGVFGGDGVVPYKQAQDVAADVVCSL